MRLTLAGRATRPTVAAAVASVLGCLLVSGCGSSSTPSSRSDDQVLLDFSGSHAGSGADAAAGGVDLDNSGKAATEQQVVAAGDGVLSPTDGADGQPGAVRFPAFDGSGPPGWSRAIIAVTNKGSQDGLDPRAGAFSYGADVWLDEVSNGSPAYDNGNNILQRGLYTSGAQYKLQFDGANASCLLHGDDGDLTVKLPVPKQSWYRLGCGVVPSTTAAGAAVDTLTLTAAPISADGAVGTAQTSAATGPVGRLEFPVDTPLSIGGKLTPQLTIVSASDQFNGCVDHAFLHLG